MSLDFTFPRPWLTSVLLGKTVISSDSVFRLILRENDGTDLPSVCLLYCLSLGVTKGARGQQDEISPDENDKKTTPT